jgi:hypothetical protein
MIISAGTIKTMEKKSASNMDLHDSEDDKRHLQPEEMILDLPDVKDIPGQENIKPPKFREMADTTASSSDEEGDEIFDDEFSDETADESEADVRGATLDSTDGDGDPINEGGLATDRFGEDLDLPEAEGVDEEDSSD